MLQNPDGLKSSILRGRGLSFIRPSGPFYSQPKYICLCQNLLPPKPNCRLNSLVQEYAALLVGLAFDSSSQTIESETKPPEGQNHRLSTMRNSVDFSWHDVLLNRQVNFCFVKAC